MTFCHLFMNRVGLITIMSAHTDSTNNVSLVSLIRTYTHVYCNNLSQLIRCVFYSSPHSRVNVDVSCLCIFSHFASEFLLSAILEYHNQGKSPFERKMFCCVLWLLLCVADFVLSYAPMSRLLLLTFKMPDISRVVAAVRALIYTICMQ